MGIRRAACRGCSTAGVQARFGRRRNTGRERTGGCRHASTEGLLRSASRAGSPSAISAWRRCAAARRTAIVMPATVRHRRQGARRMPTSPRSARSARSPCCCWSTSAGRCASASRPRPGWRSSAPSSSAWAPWPRARPWLAAVVDGGRRFRGALRRRRELGARGRVDGAAALAHPADHRQGAELRDPRPAGRLGARVGGRPDRHRGALARADAPSAAGAGRGRVPCARRPAAQPHRVPAEGAGRPVQGRARGSVPGGRGRADRAAEDLPGDALPADRADDRRPHGGAAGRRAELAAHRARRRAMRWTA